MPDIEILTLDKIGNAFAIDPNNGNLNLAISDDPLNVLKVDPSKGLLVKGLFAETIPSGNSITWAAVNITHVDVRSGMADLSNPLQIGKDVLGNIWLRGAVTNLGSAVAANTIFGVIPTDYEIANYAEDYNFFQLITIQSSLAGNTAALFLRMQNYNYQQSLAFSGSLATNVSFIIQPTIIGKAKYLFNGSFVDAIPIYTDATWVDVTITNANIVSGLADASNPLQIGKDTLGNIWMRGAVTDIATAVAANGVIGTIPIDYQIAGYISVNTFCQLTAIQSSLGGNTTALFLRFRNYNGVQSIAFSGSIAAGVSFMLQPTIIGRAKSI